MKYILFIAIVLLQLYTIGGVIDLHKVHESECKKIEKQVSPTLDELMEGL
jgi:hypothetical protein